MSHVQEEEARCKKRERREKPRKKKITRTCTRFTICEFDRWNGSTKDVVQNAAGSRKNNAFQIGARFVERDVARWSFLSVASTQNRVRSWRSDWLVEG